MGAHGEITRTMMQTRSSARSTVLSWFALPDVRAALAATLGLRVICSLFAAVPLLLSLAPRPGSGPLDYLVRPWDHWDTAWFSTIARHGYTAYGSSFFMPLYPLLMRLTAPLLGGDHVAAAVLISTVATFFALLYLYRLAERLAPRRNLGPCTLLVACCLPTSFILMAGYTESLYLALALGAILATLDHQWWRTAVLAGLAALTRQQGVLLAALALPAIWAWLRDLWRTVRGGHGANVRELGSSVMRGWPPTLAGAAPLLAYGGWIAVLAFALHAPLPWDLLAASNAWNLHITWPGSGVVADVALLLHPSRELIGMVGSAALDATLSLAALGALVVAARRLPMGLLIYLTGMWCSAQIKVLPNGLTVGEGRYMLGLLPLCVVPAAWLARGANTRRLAWVLGGTLTLGFYLSMFVIGGWAP